MILESPWQLLVTPSSWERWIIYGNAVWTIKIMQLSCSFVCYSLCQVIFDRHTKELAPVRVLETLPVDILKRMGGLPSKVKPLFHSCVYLELYYIVS